MQTVQVPFLEDDKLEKAAVILKTIAHPARLAIINMLRGNNKMSVNDICETLEMEQSLVSHHLKNMKLRGILSCKRDKQQIFYSLKEKDVAKILDCIKNCDCYL